MVDLILIHILCATYEEEEEDRVDGNNGAFSKTQKPLKLKQRRRMMMPSKVVDPFDPNGLGGGL